MKVNLEINQDEDLRAALKDMIKGQVRSTIRDITAEVILEEFDFKNWDEREKHDYLVIAIERAISHFIKKNSTDYIENMLSQLKDNAETEFANTVKSIIALRYNEIDRYVREAVSKYIRTVTSNILKE